MPLAGLIDMLTIKNSHFQNPSEDMPFAEPTEGVPIKNTNIIFTVSNFTIFAVSEFVKYDFCDEMI